MNLRFLTLIIVIYQNYPAADKTDLKEAVDAAKVLDSSDYTEESWKVFADAFADAEEVFADDTAIQSAVDQVKEALLKAQRELKAKEVPIVVDKDSLQAAVDEAVGIADKDNYTETTWTKYEKVLEDAKRILSGADVTQADVDAAVKALTDTQKALEKKPERSFVDEDEVEGEWYYDAIYYNFDSGIRKQSSGQ